MKRILGIITLLALPVALLQAEDDHKHAPAPASAAVDFGVLPTGPLGPPPCLQTGAIGGPADPCSYKQHHLTPEEITIAKRGEVTFQVHGGGHGIMIYAVSGDPGRADIGRYLCPGPDPAVTPVGDLNCNLSNSNANASHIIYDAKGKVVIKVAANVTNAFPDNRVWDPTGRFMSAGGRQFLNGGTIAAGPTSDGQLVTYQFLEVGRYLVMCMNRTHSQNDWMFGFVNVTGDQGESNDK